MKSYFQRLEQRYALLQLARLEPTAFERRSRRLQLPSLE